MDRKTKEYKNPGNMKEIWILAYPIIFTTASYTIMRFVDRMMLSWRSPEDIAASVPAGVACFTIVSLFYGISAYTNTLVSQYYGAKKYNNLSSSLWQGIFFSLMAAVFLITITPFAENLFDLSDHTPDVIEREKTYFSVLMYGSGLYVINATLASFFTGRGDTKTTMIVNIAGNVVNVVLDYLLIFGNYGFPDLGIFGAGLATNIGNGIITLLFLSRIFSKKIIKQYRIIQNFKFNRTLFRKLIRYGLPSGVQYMLGILSFTVFIFIVGSVGKNELVATNVAIVMNMLAYMPVVGMGIATSTLVGQYIGRNMKEVSIKVTYNSFKVVTIYSGIMGFLFFFFPELFLSLFSDSKENLAILIEHGKPILRVLSLYLIADGIAVILENTLKGAGDTVFQMFSMILTAWLLYVPGIYIIIKVLNYDVLYAWWWCLVFLISYSLILYLRFRSGKWKEFDLISEQKAEPEIIT